jgi:hypothetical protein
VFWVFGFAAILTAAAHDGHHGGGHAKESGGAVAIARGVVFEDADGDGKRGASERGLEGVKVSNGRGIVKTNAAGAYEIEVDDDTTIFVIKPRGWMTPVTDDQLPRFYYTHKPNGSPATKFAGVAPTGPLPESIDFALHKRDEPQIFKALLFGDTQPRDLKEVEYIAHDVVEQVIAEKAHGAALGVTLGDVVFDDLSVFKPLAKTIGLIGIPWYNVIGNHDMNYDSPDDKHADETFESHFGPPYYSFDHGPVHFMVLDDVTWVGATGGEKGKYHGGLGKEQMEFIRNDLAMIPHDQLVVLMMHIPLTEVEDRAELFRLIEKRPFALSISAHTHFQEHRLITRADGWEGPEPHHHVVNVTVCGSWWEGSPDERGIPHATMRDGAPNGYSIVTFDGRQYAIEFRAARRPASYQMNIYAPEEMSAGESGVQVLANVFAGSEKSIVEMRVGADAGWFAMKRVPLVDPDFQRMKDAEAGPVPPPGRALPNTMLSPHIWRAELPPSLAPGSHLIEVRTIDMFGKAYIDRRSIRVRERSSGAVRNDRVGSGGAR